VETAANRIIRFLDEVIRELIEGRLDLKFLGIDDEMKHNGKGYELVYRGHAVTLHSEKMAVIVDGFTLETDTWTREMHDRLSGACNERWVFQMQEEADREQKKAADSAALVRQARYEELAKRLG
jgi:hypothetical protein